MLNQGGHQWQTSLLTAQWYVWPKSAITALLTAEAVHWQLKKAALANMWHIIDCQHGASCSQQHQRVQVKQHAIKQF